MTKKLNFRPTRSFWAYICLGVIAVILAVILAPLWSGTNVFFKSWGSKIVDIMMAVAILAYLILFLAKKIKRAPNTTIQILTVVEFVLLSVIALGCVLSQFKVINVGGPCQILGLALWCRGTVELFRAYYYRRDSSVHYPVWYVALAVAMVSFGTYIFAKPFFTALHLQWIFCGAIGVAGVLLIIYGIMVKPKKNK